MKFKKYLAGVLLGLLSLPVLAADLNILTMPEDTAPLSGNYVLEACPTCTPKDHKLKANFGIKPYHPSIPGAALRRILPWQHEASILPR